MTTSDARNPVSATATRSPMAAWLMRILAINAVALYAWLVSMVHWLRQVPIHYTWMAGVLGFMLMFLAAGVLSSGKPLGFFYNREQRLCPDWLPLMLVWPIGLSIWGCLMLGLATIQTKQQLANGLALPFMQVAAVLPPLLLSRLPAWPQPRLRWHRQCDLLYVLTTLISAGLLFVAVYQALLDDPSVATPTVASTTASTPAPAAVTAPALSTASASVGEPAPVAVTPYHGFACDPNAHSATGEGDTPDNQCEPSATHQAEIPVALGTLMGDRPIDQFFSLWGAVLLLAGGMLLVLARLIGVRRMSGLPAAEASLLSQVTGSGKAAMLSSAGSLLRSSGVPGADVLAAMVGKTMQAGASDHAALPAALTAAESARTLAEPALAVVPAAATVTPVTAPAELAAAQVSTTSELTAPATATPADSKPAQEDVKAVQDGLSQQQQATSQLQDSVKGMNEQLAKQQDAAKQLQDKLEQQNQMLTQLATEAQQSAEETRRTNDSLTRLMKGMKADLERLSKN